MTNENIFVVKIKTSREAHLPEKEEAEGDLDGSKPHSIEVHDKIHELLSIGWDQIHNLSYRTRPPRRTVYHQRLQIDKKIDR